MLVFICEEPARFPGSEYRFLTGRNICIMLCCNKCRPFIAGCGLRLYLQDMSVRYLHLITSFTFFYILYKAEVHYLCVKRKEDSRAPKTGRRPRDFWPRLGAPCHQLCRVPLVRCCEFINVYKIVLNPRTVN